VINLPSRECRAWLEGVARQDPAALQFLSSLFGPEEPCFTCMRPIGDAAWTMTSRPDPAKPGMDIVVAICRECAQRPDRNRREIAVFDAMFGQYKVKTTWRRQEQPGYARGGRPKRSKGRGNARIEMAAAAD
jgi:hypothetical protein